MIYTFANCTLDAALRTVHYAGQTIRLRPKAIQVCLYLLEHRDRVISKDELIEQVWPDQFISESTLASTIREVRQAIGDSSRSQRVIQVLHGYGYQFTAAVTASSTPTRDHEDQDTARDVATQPGGPHAEENRSCPACQHINRAAARFCELCGQRLDEGAPLAKRDIAPIPGPVVGREQELARLKAWFKRTELGQGHAVGLVGPPGIGRTRLLAAFCEDLREQPIITLEVRCLPDGQRVPFFPVRDLIRQYSHMAETDTVEALTEKLSYHLQMANLVPEEHTDEILHLLGIPEAGDRLSLLRPAMVRVRMLVTLRQMFLNPSRRQPLVMIIHDLHWIDPTSAMWLSSFVDSLADTPTLLLTTYHTGYQPPWMSAAAATEMPLPPLSSQPSLRVVHAIQPPAPLSDPLAQAFVAQAKGNPLFLEALTWVPEDLALATSPKRPSGCGSIGSQSLLNDSCKRPR
ncbi:MAG: hypothetical protein ETSY1_01700 [Candidatus Entotheonella factor]|uniref:OmpR/PhoB-type domain-containing protein n=1 Tax=Entotheonella factor TaxID=1429438 RepID=W4LZZ7_ENTF1|nr:AAA family ATPase [Candidatus Entotheonella palauensis]ETX02972.1 MAG: hypothetical protein ETSY1_01700 [Candidatus Entotheonella factor]